MLSDPALRHAMCTKTSFIVWPTLSTVECSHILLIFGAQQLQQMSLEPKNFVVVA